MTILELTKEQEAKIRQQFSSISEGPTENTVIVKDWLDDSIQIVEVK